MVVRFDRKSVAGEASDAKHYNGFMMPSDGVYSELLALLPERSDVLSVRGVIWKIVSTRGGTVGYIAVDAEGAYTTGLFGEDLPVRSIPNGEITALAAYRGLLCLNGDAFAEIIKKI